MRVAWGRVEMPWANWHPLEDQPPAPDQRVEDAMEMARRLAARGIPVIVSAWFPPAWAVEGDIRNYWRRGGGVRAYRLDSTKTEAIYRSLADYLEYLKKHYGVEAYAFSFNESDLGIDVYHTPEQHARFIREMGAYLANRGLATRILLGDNSDATTFDFIVPAMEGLLRPTQRFWNLKQLASTPKGVFSVPFNSDKELINCAAFCNPATGAYAIHIVNNGASRKATLEGVPAGEAILYVTGEQEGMKETGRVSATGGIIKLTLPAASFISLICSSGNGP